MRRTLAGKRGPFHRPGNKSLSRTAKQECRGSGWNREEWDRRRKSRPLPCRPAAASRFDWMLSHIVAVFTWDTASSNLVGEFQRLREKLRTDGERIQREIEEYSELSQMVIGDDNEQTAETFRPIRFPDNKHESREGA